MAKLIHPDGECTIARACANKGIIQGVRSLRIQTLPVPNAIFLTSMSARCRITHHSQSKSSRGQHRLEILFSSYM